MLILGIESSCDETGIALYDSLQGTRGLLAQALHSQIDMHQAYGGVVPELASRDHIRRTLPLIQNVLRTAQVNLQAVDALAVTQGPGLAGALLVGVSIAHAIGFALQKPVIPIHHLEGHLLSPLLAAEPPEFPFVALLVSGGHSQFMRVDAVGQYTLLGETLDDAAGEAFDKTAQLLGLGYPGGPALAKLAAQGIPGQFSLPRPMLHSGDLNLSFSGLKTAVLNQIQQTHQPSAMDESTRANLARAFEDAIVEVLVSKCVQALKTTGLTRIVLAGGVSANQRLRTQLNTQLDLLSNKQRRATLKDAAQPTYVAYYPEPQLCTDNGAMIAFAAALRCQAGLAPLTTQNTFSIQPRWNLCGDTPSLRRNRAAKLELKEQRKQQAKPTTNAHR